MRYFLVFFLNFWAILLFGQEENSRLEKAIYRSNFHLVERCFKKEVRKHKKGKEIQNGNSRYTVHHETAEYLVSWLKQHNNVLEAHSDRCENHISIYPGWFQVGAIFQTKNGIAERTFTVQEGKTGTINFFKWRFHVFKSKNVLVYKHMKCIPGFVQIQKWNCRQEEQKAEIRDSIPIKNLLGKWKNARLPKEIDDPPIIFQMNRNELELVSAANTYVLFRRVSPTAVLGHGIVINWPPYDCFVKQIDENHISIEYFSLGTEPVSLLFVRVAY